MLVCRKKQGYVKETQPRYSKPLRHMFSDTPTTSGIIYTLGEQSRLFSAPPLDALTVHRQQALPFRRGHVLHMGQYLMELLAGYQSPSLQIAKGGVLAKLVISRDFLLFRHYCKYQQ